MVLHEDVAVAELGEAAASGSASAPSPRRPSLGLGTPTPGRGGCPLGGWRVLGASHRFFLGLSATGSRVSLRTWQGRALQSGASRSLPCAFRRKDTSPGITRS